MTVTDGHPECVLNQNICIQMNEQIQEENYRQKVNGKVDIVEKENKTESGCSYVQQETFGTKLNNLSVRSNFNVRSMLLRWSKGDVHGDLSNVLCGEYSCSSFSSSSSSSSSPSSSSSSSSSSSPPCNVQNNDSTDHNGADYCQRNKNISRVESAEKCGKKNHEIGKCKDVIKTEIGSFHDKNTTEIKNKFDIIIAADCLFFKDFHEDLIWVLSHSLNKGGYCFLLQPTRGNTMGLFLEKIKSSLLFNVLYVKEDYNSEV